MMSTATPSLHPYSYRFINPNATLHYIRDPEQANAHIQALSGPVGFDLEWKPTFTKNSTENPVAVVQLANNHTVLVIQVAAMPEFPTMLKTFLESPHFVKAGVAIQSDVKKLYKDWRVSTRNCVDLSLLARCVDNTRWKGPYTAPLGLARLIAAYENLALPKGRISRSNWENQPLTSKQSEYAGNDAHAGYLLYQRLSAMSSTMQQVPNSVYYSFDAIQGQLLEPTGMRWNCHNPDYDPGPPPPPKPQKPISTPKSEGKATPTMAPSVAPSTNLRLETKPNHLLFSSTPAPPPFHNSLRRPFSSRIDPVRAPPSLPYTKPPLRLRPSSSYAPVSEGPGRSTFRLNPRAISIKLRPFLPG